MMQSVFAQIKVIRIPKGKEDIIIRQCKEAIHIWKYKEAICIPQRKEDNHGERKIRMS